MYLDALVVKVREQGSVVNRSVYLALGVNMEGRKELMGLWMADTEGAKFWLGVLSDLTHRGVQDILIACCDGLKGFPDAIEATFPHTTVQTCIVHMVRNSLRYVPWKNRKAVAKDLRAIYTAANEDDAAVALDEFEVKWGKSYPIIVRSWRSNWERVIPFLAFPGHIRRAIYTTNAIEALNRQLRKILKTRGHFRAGKLPRRRLPERCCTWRCKTPRRSGPCRSETGAWPGLAVQQFAIHFEGRMPV